MKTYKSVWNHCKSVWKHYTSVWNIIHPYENIINLYEYIINPHENIINPYENVINPYENIKNHYENIKSAWKHHKSVWKHCKSLWAWNQRRELFLLFVQLSGKEYMGQVCIWLQRIFKYLLFLLGEAGMGDQSILLQAKSSLPAPGMQLSC